MRSPLVYLTVLVIATCGLVYELVAGTLASYVLGDSVTQFSTVIGGYLSAMGLGSYLSRYVQRGLARRFVEVELGVNSIARATILFMRADRSRSHFQQSNFRYRIYKLRRSVDNLTSQLRGAHVQDKTLGSPQSLGIGIVWFMIALGCAPDGSRENPFRVENDALKRHLAKQESLLSSLQDGNKVMQQQIDLLNQELRDAKSSMEVTKADAKRLNEQMELQLAETKRMITAQMAESLKIEEKGAQSDTLPRPMPTVAKVVEDALARNGYHLKVSVKTDQRAVYVTERKISTPATLEMTGSRNQYLVSLEALPDSVTKLGVKAEFERVAQGGRILSVSHEETSEIERRLISEINKALESPQKT